MNDDKQITYIGKTDFRNTMTQFGIRAKDRLRHMYIIGKSGTGKTTLIENMLVQDIYNGNGVAFLDPHGESADRILNYIPLNRLKDVVYLFPGDFEYPVAFNPMETTEETTAAQRALITDGLMTVFKKIWPEAFSGRMEYILNNTILALLENPEPNLLGVNRVLTEKEYRKKIIANVKDPTVRNAWEELLKWDDKRWSEAIAALVNKIGQFTTNPIIRNIIGQTKSTFDFRWAMDNKKIIIMNLSKGLIGEQSAKLLGALLITKIYLAAMSREDLSPEEKLNMPPMYFYVDEFQNFANESFANILSESRKYKLALIAANQFIAQMEEPVRDAVFGNMGTTIAFRVGPLDAEFMERVFAPVFSGEDLQNIGFGQIFLTLLIDGMASKPFSAATLPPIHPREEPHKEEVIETSRKNYARPRAEVEQKVLDWFEKQQKKIAVASLAVKKVPVTPVQPVSKESEVVAGKEKEVSVKLSPAISGLLDKLENGHDESKTELVPQKVEQKSVPTVKPPEISQPAPAPVKKLEKEVKDRAATPETKNALMEVLQKAKVQKEAEQPAPIIKNLEALKNALQKAQETTIEPTKETIKKTTAQKTVAKKIVEESAESVQEEKPPTKKKVREVPEDILKKLLE